MANYLKYIGLFLLFALFNWLSDANFNLFGVLLFTTLIFFYSIIEKLPFFLNLGIWYVFFSIFVMYIVEVDFHFGGVCLMAITFSFVNQFSKEESKANVFM